MSSVIANGRIMRIKSNGQQRVAQEIITRLNLDLVAPPAENASGLKGHLWEQTILPLRLRGRPLWSPSTSAPMFYRNQVVTVHDIGFVDAPQYFTPRFAATYRHIVGRVTKIARHLVTVSEFSRQRIISHYNVAPDAISAIHLGIAEAFTIRSPDEVAQVRDRFKLGDVPYLVAFSGSDARKNTKGVLNAWNQIESKRGPAKLVLFGKASNASVFGAAEAVPDFTDVVQVGAVSDDELAALFSGSNGLVFPSFYEGFGLPIIEAAASGAPVITTDYGAMQEVAPSFSILIDPTSLGELSGAMLTCLQTTPDAKRRTAIAAQTQRYSWDEAARQYAGIFQDKLL